MISNSNKPVITWPLGRLANLSPLCDNNNASLQGSVNSNGYCSIAVMVVCVICCRDRTCRQFNECRTMSPSAFALLGMIATVQHYFSRCILVTVPDLVVYIELGYSLAALALLFNLLAVSAPMW